MVDTEEYTVFPKSTYQSDGWEPFLPNHPLADTLFEHLAVEFQARKRKLDKVRASQALDAVGANASRTTSVRKQEIPSNSLPLNLPKAKSEQSDRLRLVDEDFQEYVTFAGYQPTADQIKRFLYVEARRLSCAFPGFDFGGASFASVKNERKKEVSSTTDSHHAKEIDEDAEEENYREALRRFADLHRRPKIVEMIMNLSGSGAANLTTDFRSDIYIQSLAVFKTGLCRTLKISKSDVSILGVKNTTVGKLAESVEIDIQIFTYRMEFCSLLAESIRSCVSSGNLASELNNIGLTVFVTLRAGPIFFQYPREIDYTKTFFGGAAAELLRNRISMFKSAAFGVKVQQILKGKSSAASELPEFILTTEEDDRATANKAGLTLHGQNTTASKATAHDSYDPLGKESGHIKTATAEEDGTSNDQYRPFRRKSVKRQQSERRSKSTTLSERKSIFFDKYTTDIFPSMQSKTHHGFELHNRPATVAGSHRTGPSPEMRAHLARSKRLQKDGMDKWSLAIPAAQIEDLEQSQDREKNSAASDDHVPKLMAYFAKATDMRKTPSTGCRTEKIKMLRREWDLDMAEIRKAAHRGKETDDFALEKLRSITEAIHVSQAENNRKSRANFASLSPSKPTIVSAGETISGDNPFITTQKTASRVRDQSEENPSKAKISLPLFAMKPSAQSNQPAMQNVYDLLIDDDSEGEEADTQMRPARRGIPSMAPRSRPSSIERIEREGSSKNLQRQNRRSRSPNRPLQSGEEQYTRIQKNAPLDMGRAERLGVAALSQSHVDHVLKDDLLLNAVDYSKEAVARNLKVEKQFQPIARRVERKMQLTYRKGGILTCMVCRDRRKLPIAGCIPTLIELLNPKGIEGLEEIDCPYCLGLNAKYRFDPIRYNRPVPNDGWEPPKFCPPLGSNQLIVQVSVPDIGVHGSPFAIAGVWLSSIFGNFYAISTQGTIVEAELGTGRIVRRFNDNKKVEVTCTCSTKTHLFLGVGSAIIEVDKEIGAHSRTLNGMRGQVMCCTVSSDSKMLAAGSSDCTTFIWELETGRICRHVVDCTFSLPDQIKHLADEFSNKSQTFTFRHHLGPVSCCALRKDAVITGSWDGTICVASLSSYRERWTEEYVVKMLEKKTKSLSREAKNVAVDLAERTQERKKSVRIFRQHAENLENLKNTLEIIKSTLTSKKSRLQNMGHGCRKFLCSPDTAGRITCMSMQYLKKTGFMLFAAYSDGKIRQWDIKSEAVIRTFVSGRDHDVTCMCFGGDRMFTAGEHGTIKVWHIVGLAQNTATAIHKNEFDITGHRNGVVSMKACNNVLVSAAEDNTIRVWNLIACDFEPNLPEANPKETEMTTQGDLTAREAPLTARSARSTLSTGSSLSSFFGSVQGDFAGKIVSISIFDEPIVWRLDSEDDSMRENSPVDTSPPPEIVEDHPSDIESDSSDDHTELLQQDIDQQSIPPLSETVYMDLLEMACTLPTLNNSLKESIDAANKWSRRQALLRPDSHKT